MSIWRLSDFVYFTPHIYANQWLGVITKVGAKQESMDYACGGGLARPRSAATSCDHSTLTSYDLWVVCCRCMAKAFMLCVLCHSHPLPSDQGHIASCEQPLLILNRDLKAVKCACTCDLSDQLCCYHSQKQKMLSQSTRERGHIKTTHFHFDLRGHVWSPILVSADNLRTVLDVFWSLPCHRHSSKLVAHFLSHTPCINLCFTIHYLFWCPRLSHLRIILPSGGEWTAFALMLIGELGGVDWWLLDIPDTQLFAHALATYTGCTCVRCNVSNNLWNIYQTQIWQQQAGLDMSVVDMFLMFDSWISRM